MKYWEMAATVSYSNEYASVMFAKGTKSVRSYASCGTERYRGYRVVVQSGTEGVTEGRYREQIGAVEQIGAKVEIVRDGTGGKGWYRGRGAV